MHVDHLMHRLLTDAYLLPNTEFFTTFQIVGGVAQWLGRRSLASDFPDLCLIYG